MIDANSGFGRNLGDKDAIQVSSDFTCPCTMPLVKKAALHVWHALQSCISQYRYDRLVLHPGSKQEVLEWHLLSLASVSSTKCLLQEKASEFDDIDATVEIDDGESLQYSPFSRFQRCHKHTYTHPHACMKKHCHCFVILWAGKSSLHYTCCAIKAAVYAFLQTSSKHWVNRAAQARHRPRNSQHIRHR